MKKLYQLWNSKGTELSQIPNQPEQNALLSMITQKYSLDLTNTKHINKVKTIALFENHTISLLNFPFTHSHTQRHDKSEELQGSCIPDEISTFFNLSYLYDSINFLNKQKYSFLPGCYGTTN